MYDIKPMNDFINNPYLTKRYRNSLIADFEAQRIIDLKIRKLYWDWNDNKIKQCRHINVVSVKE